MKTTILALLVSLNAMASPADVFEKNIGLHEGRYAGSGAECAMEIVALEAGHYQVVFPYGEGWTIVVDGTGFTQKRNTLKNVKKGRRCNVISRYWGCEDIPDTYRYLHFDSDQKFTGYEVRHGESASKCEFNR